MTFGSRTDVRLQLRTSVRDLLGRKDVIGPGFNLTAGNGVDSLDHLAIVTETEALLRIDIPDARAIDVKTVGDLERVGIEFYEDKYGPLPD
ncbi:MAG: hypothetical protein JWO51_1084 [Rhodospirillales bacterium]|nr:hypothetical protein [Rhodospirillales bacterium]